MRRLFAFLAADGAAGLLAASRRRVAPARAAVRLASAAAAPFVQTAKYTLLDVPVSNNGARVRMILYYLGVEPDEVAVVSPAALGGLQSAQFLALNPQGKMPTLLCRDEEMALPESDTIARFVGGKFAKPGAAFSPAAGSLLAAKADRIARHHDMYLAAIQTCLYREPVKGFLSCGTRDDALAEFVRQLDVLEDLVDAEGPYMLGAEPTHADAACFPTIAFAEFMLPLFQGREFKLGPKLTKWWQHMTSGADPVASRVYGELRGDLEKWQAKGRWAPILGAGLRDDAPATVFDKILDGSIPAAVVYEDDRCLAFKDVNPVSPQHLLLIPKKRDGLTRLKHATADHQFILGHLLSKVGAVAAAAGLEDYRVVVNDGAQAGQTTASTVDGMAVQTTAASEGSGKDPWHVPSHRHFNSRPDGLPPPPPHHWWPRPRVAARIGPANGCGLRRNPSSNHFSAITS